MLYWNRNTHPRQEESAMKTIYILLTRSGTLLSKLVYSVTGANTIPMPPWPLMRT